MKTTLWYIPWGESGQCLYRSFFFNSLANCKLLVCPLRSLVILDLLTRNWGLYLPHTTDDRIIWSYLMLHWFLPCPGNVTGRESQYIRNHYRKVFVEVPPKNPSILLFFFKCVLLVCVFSFYFIYPFLSIYPFHICKETSATNSLHLWSHHFRASRLVQKGFLRPESVVKEEKFSIRPVSRYFEFYNSKQRSYFSALNS